MARSKPVGEVMSMPFYTLNQIHPRKRGDFTALEIAEAGGIFAHVRSHLIRGTLTATMRRESAHGAWAYLKLTWGDVASIPRTIQTEGLVRVILSGYASKANAFSILSGDVPHILDGSQMLTAIRASGCSDFDTIYTLARIWWDALDDAPAPVCTLSAKKQQDKLKASYAHYKENPNPTTTEAVVIYLLPVTECRVCLQTGYPPTLEQASRAKARSYSHGRGYSQAVQVYIDHIINDKKR